MAEPEITSAAEAAERIDRFLAQSERERARVRPEDWRTLFRQMRSVLEELSSHPFVRGDAEAEGRLARAMMAEDLEALDERFDHFSEYLEGKMALQLVLRGEEPGSARMVNGAAQGRAARSAAAHGPSGDDFAAPGDGDRQAPRRTVLRL